MKNTITVIETTHNLSGGADWGDANQNHMSLLAAAGVTNVGPDDGPPEGHLMIEVLNPTPTSVTLRTKVDGIHCRIDQEERQLWPSAAE